MSYDLFSRVVAMQSTMVVCEVNGLLAGIYIYNNHTMPVHKLF